MRPTNQLSPPGPSPPPPPSPSPSPTPSLSRQNKAVVQREYRKEEGESFNTLRDVIKNLTGEEPRTRQEILRKATDLLLHFSKLQNQSNAQASTLTTYEAPTSVRIPVPVDTALSYSDTSYSPQPTHWIQTPQSNAGFDAMTHYYAPQLHQQQYHLIPPMDSTFSRSDSSGYTGDPSINYLPFGGGF